MSKRDYYEILGVSKEADAGSIKSAYRKLAMKYHPDRNAGDKTAEKNFKEISEAYEILSNSEKKQAYDTYGHDAFNQTGGGFSEGFGGFGGFSDIFEDFFGDFGGKGQQKREQKGQDLKYEIDVDLREAYVGIKKEISFDTLVRCDSCHGSGSEKGNGLKNCGICGGSGRTRASQGFFTVERTCSACGGAGQVITDPCGTCSGEGRTRKNRKLEVNIPAGVEDGSRIRLSGEGAVGPNGATPGDLYLFVSMVDHPIFQRDSVNIHCNVPISIVDASLGGSVEVPTVSGGKAKVKIPAGSQNGDQFRLNGKGMPSLRSTSFGDMIISLLVEIPKNLSENQKRLLKEFNNELTQSNNPESSGFFSKVKDFWDGLT
tara:strand:- start:368 stop:1486 length:1119 start_codon:yes stop_codon:yes gene_type:complete